MACETLTQMAAAILSDKASARSILESLAANERAPLTGFGLTIEHSWSGETHKDAIFSALSKWHALHVEPFRPNAVLVDTTTLATVSALATGVTQHTTLDIVITPGLLYDLCAFVNAVVLFDTVFHLESPHFDASGLNRSLAARDSPLRELPVQSFDGDASGLDPIPGVGGALTSLMWNAQAEVRGWHRGATPVEREARDAVAAGWKCATDLDLGTEKFANADCLDHSFYSNGPSLLKQALEFDEGSPDFHTLLSMSRGYLTESNVRSVFNTGLSEMIGVGYATSSARLPFRRYWLEVQDAVRKQLLLAAHLDIALRDAATRTVDRATLELPFFAAAVFARATDRSGILPAIGQLRDEAAGLRSRRAELDDAIDQNNQRVIKQLTGAVQAESRSLAKTLAVPVIGAAVASVTAPVTLAHSLWIPLLGLYGAATQLGAADRDRMIRRLSRRHLCFLTKTADQSRELLDAYPVIRKLWPVAELRTRDEFAKRFASLGKLGEA